MVLGFEGGRALVSSDLRHWSLEGAVVEVAGVLLVGGGAEVNDRSLGCT